MKLEQIGIHSTRDLLYWITHLNKKCKEGGHKQFHHDTLDSFARLGVDQYEYKLNKLIDRIKLFKAQSHNLANRIFKLQKQVDAQRNEIASLRGANPLAQSK
jgi:hypothetical protein